MAKPKTKTKAINISMCLSDSIDNTALFVSKKQYNSSIKLKSCLSDIWKDR